MVTPAASLRELFKALQSRGHGRLQNNSSPREFQRSFDSDQEFLDLVSRRAVLRIVAYLLLICLLGCAQPIAGQVVFDSTSSSCVALAGSTNSVTFTHSISSQPNGLLLGNLFSSSHPTLGMALLKAKQGVRDGDVRRTYMLFGVPIMKLR